jgi:hypothetical protein
MGGTLERILHDVHNVHGLSLCERRERCVQRKRAFLFAMTWQRTKRGRFEPLLGQPKCTVDIWLRRWSSSRFKARNFNVDRSMTAKGSSWCWT